MNDRWARLAAALLVTFTLLVDLKVHGQTNQETRSATVLFKQFEAVAFTKSHFLSGFDAQNPSDQNSEADLRFPFLEFMGAIRYLGPGAESDLENGYGVFMVGAKDFAPPSGLGPIRSRKCYIGVLTSGAQPDIEHDFARAATTSIDGRQVWMWPAAPVKEDQTKMYAAQVSGEYFVMANNLQDFQQAVEGLTSTESLTPAAIGVLGWKTFGTHEYWAYRLFGRNGNIGSEAVSGLGSVTQDVIALAFFADLDKRESFIQVFSSDTTMKTEPKAFLPKSESDRLQPLGHGVWQARIPVSEDEVRNDSLFRVFYLLGFGLFV